MNRRTFLKIASIGSVAFAAGCSADSKNNLFTMVEATEDMVTGKASWYASTCRECPAGCGVLAKNREGRVIKLEGNPLHPVNQGNPVHTGTGRPAGPLQPGPLDAAPNENRRRLEGDLLSRSQIIDSAKGGNRVQERKQPGRNGNGNGGADAVGPLYQRFAAA
jgi:hypothetical protein